MTEKKISRRTFLGGAAASSLLLSGCAGLQTQPTEASKGKMVGGTGERKLNIACIGYGGQAANDIEGLSSENIIALCDVDDVSKGSLEIIQQFPNARRFRDYREMLTEMDKQIDAVLVATPDHTHYPAALMAITMGKHVFVEKPLTRTIWEAHQLLEAAREYGVQTQMGNQGHANQGTRIVREWVQSGFIGPVHEVHLWTNRPIWPQGIDRPEESTPIPYTFDWNLWLGTAPERPHHDIYHPFNWRGWWDYGTGALGDMGCHIMDASFWALDLHSPISVEAESSPVNDETAPKWSIVTYKFPARGNMPPVKVVWYDGDKVPPRPKEFDEMGFEFGEDDDGGSGQLIFGEKATIMAGTYCESPRIIPESKWQDMAPNRPPQTIPRVPDGDHYREWINACKGGPVAGSNFEYSVPLTEMVLLGNLAIRSGKPIQWDSENLRVTNVPEANQYVKESYRDF